MTKNMAPIAFGYNTVAASCRHLLVSNAVERFLDLVMFCCLVSLFGRLVSLFSIKNQFDEVNRKLEDTLIRVECRS